MEWRGWESVKKAMELSRKVSGELRLTEKDLMGLGLTRSKYESKVVNGGFSLQEFIFLCDLAGYDVKIEKRG